MKLSQKLLAEGLGTAFLLAAVVGSGIMGERLAGGNMAIALLANSLATGAALIAILQTVGPISGAHLNPVVTLTLAARGDVPWSNVTGYLIVQIVGAVLGVMAAQAMFDLPLIDLSMKARSSLSIVWSEFVATSGLLGVVLIGSRRNPVAVPYAVAGYVTAAYWFTSSTSFANPAVTIARSLTNTFAGIHFTDVPAFILAQLAAAFFAWVIIRKTTTVAPVVDRTGIAHEKVVS